METLKAAVAVQKSQGDMGYGESRHHERRDMRDDKVLGQKAHEDTRFAQTQRTTISDRRLVIVTDSLGRGTTWDPLSLWAFSVDGAQMSLSLHSGFT